MERGEIGKSEPIRPVAHTAAALEAASQDQAAASPQFSPDDALAQRNGSCRFEADVDYDRGGGGRAHATGVASKEACCVLCKERPSCGVATYLAASQQCWFKPFLATRRPSQSSAGVVSCILTEREPNESWVPKSRMPVLLSVRNGSFVSAGGGADVLVCLFGSVRGSASTWQTLHRHVLTPLHADLAVLLSLGVTLPRALVPPPPALPSPSLLPRLPASPLSPWACSILAISASKYPKNCQHSAHGSWRRALRE